MNYLIVIIATLGFIIYDYLHTKPNWTLSANWLKYAIGLGTGIFIVTVTSIPIIKDIAYAGAVVGACLLSGIIWKFVTGLFGKSSTTTTPSGKV